MSARLALPAGRALGITLQTAAGPAEVFRGLPYAEPPTGALRFQPARPAAPWPGELDASAPAPAPPQRRGALLATRPVASTSEACLTLNIWRPAGTTSAARLPVLCWLFGGMFSNGDASDASADGAHLAARGQLLVVAVNYRLGALGFATCGGHANNGLGDQLAALAWLQRNIAAAGGDPAAVCLAGESAGAMSVAALLASPAARGLVHRAICQSGAAAGLRPRAVVDAASLELAAALAPATPGSATLEHLLDAQMAQASRHRQSGQAQPLRPTCGDTVLPQHPLAATRAGTALAVPMLLGMNLDEQRLYLRPRLADSADKALALVEARLATLFPDLEPRALAEQLYSTWQTSRRRIAERDDPAALAAALLGDLTFRRPLDALAEAREHHQPGQTWRYLFNIKSPALRGWLGACHALEIPYVFGNTGAAGLGNFVGTASNSTQLAEQTMDHWAAFIHGRPLTRPWQPGGELLLIDQHGCRASADPVPAEHAALATLPPLQPEC